MRTLTALLQLVRPRQWIKNLLVFAGLMFTANIFNLELLLKVVHLFAVFCLASGAVYIFNDVKDVDSDRLHPKKKQRPLAAGKITPQTAQVAGLILAALSLVWAAWLSTAMFWLVAAFLLLNLAYTLGLKHAVILDVFTIAAGFVLRAAAGALLIQVPISAWLLIVTTLLALFLGFAKRRHELVSMGARAAQHRKSLDEYSPELLDQFMGVVASSTIIAYSLYAFTSSTAREHQYLMLTVPFVIYGILRYLYLVYQKNLGGAPELVLLKDKPLIFVIALWILTVGLILHLG